MGSGKKRHENQSPRSNTPGQASSYPCILVCTIAYQLPFSYPDSQTIPPHQKRLSLAHLVDRGDNIFDMFAPSGCLFLVHSTHYFCHPHLYLQRQPACRVFRCHGWGQNVGWHTRKFFMHNPRDKDVLS